MLSLVVVILQKVVDLGLGDCISRRVFAQALILDCPVKAFYVSIVVRLSDTTMAKGYALRLKHVLEVMLEFRSVVCLNSSKVKSHSLLGVKGYN